jgi:hypothetical protein
MSHAEMLGLDEAGFPKSGHRFWDKNLGSNKRIEATIHW